MRSIESMSLFDRRIVEYVQASGGDAQILVALQQRLVDIGGQHPGAFCSQGKRTGPADTLARGGHQDACPQAFLSCESQVCAARRSGGDNVTHQPEMLLKKAFLTRNRTVRAAAF